MMNTNYKHRAVKTVEKKVMLTQHQLAYGDTNWIKLNKDRLTQVAMKQEQRVLVICKQLILKPQQLSLYLLALTLRKIHLKIHNLLKTLIQKIQLAKINRILEEKTNNLKNFHQLILILLILKV
jgi:hypothetical protein